VRGGRRGPDGMTAGGDAGATFMARMTASATHEIRNVLAIVKESAGLIEDLLGSGAAGEASTRERVRRAAGRIDAQVARGAEVAGTLNRLAHALEGDEGTLDLAEEVAQAVCLSRRSATQRGHTLAAAPSPGGVSVVAPALLLQMVLAAAVEYCLEQLPAPGTVTARAVRHGRCAAVELQADVGPSAVATPPAGEGWRRLTDLAGALGVTVETGADAGRLRLVWQGREAT
jgi:C4-dicarboxylate-specific signal transduction histidine kinase